MKATDFERPAVFLVNGLGDHILALPALRALSEMFPDRLTLLCCPGMRELFFNQIAIQQVVELTLEAGRSFSARTVASKIGKCDLFLSLVPWHSLAITELVRLLNPTCTIGFFPTFQRVLSRNYNIHAADLAFSLPKFINPTLSLEHYAEPSPCFPVEGQSGAQNILNAIPRCSRRLAVHMDTHRCKMWYPEGYSFAINSFLASNPDFVVFLVGCSSPPVDWGVHVNRVFPTYGVSLEVAFCLVAEAHLFLGIDSCMLHVADICRVPGVGLFGPTKSEEFGFRFAPHRHHNGHGTLHGIKAVDVCHSLEVLAAGSSSAGSLP